MGSSRESSLSNRPNEIEFSDVYSGSVLQQAIIHGNLSAILTLLSHQGYLKGDDEAQASPLTDAAKSNHYKIFKALLRDAKVDPLRKVNHEVDEEILGEEIKGG